MSAVVLVSIYLLSGSWTIASHLYLTPIAIKLHGGPLNVRYLVHQTSYTGYHEVVKTLLNGPCKYDTQDHRPVPWCSPTAICLNASIAWTELKLRRPRALKMKKACLVWWWWHAIYLNLTSCWAKYSLIAKQWFANNCETPSWSLCLHYFWVHGAGGTDGTYDWAGQSNLDQQFISVSRSSLA